MERDMLEQMKTKEIAYVAGQGSMNCLLAGCEYGVGIQLHVVIW